MKENVIKIKSFEFAVEITKVCRELMNQKEFTLSRQLLRAGTSIGANVNEALFADSKRDFAYRLGVALRECSETMFWLQLLNATDYLSYQTFKKLHDRAGELRRILSSIVKTTREKLIKN
ncbi:four helix bundle protein [Chryseolinea sp. T2]|uniref:four helix bundle protein n=1 Tax=Chryseolinea sp. T2 TaxID=3129255 RepID=UPI003077E44A